MSQYIEPVGLLSGPAAEAATGAGEAVFLAGGPYAFAHLHLLARRAGEAPTVERLTLADIRRRADSDSGIARNLDRLTAVRPVFAGLALGGAATPRVMGIVNVTPDSFSDGGAHADPRRAIEYAKTLIDAGADIVDIGGESTRPGADPVDEASELARVMPVVEALAAERVPVSIDTRRASVMAAAVASGAVIVNDVTALAGDRKSLGVVADTDANVVLMHMAGDPRTMQDAPAYEDAALDIFDALEARIAACEAAGIARSRLCVDPGIGFGKTAAHNAELLHRLALFHGLGCPVMVGASRKSFIARIAGDAPADRRLGGSLAAAVMALSRGCQILRVHDVVETHQAVALASRIAAGR